MVVSPSSPNPSSTYQCYTINLLKGKQKHELPEGVDPAKKEVRPYDKWSDIRSYSMYKVTLNAQQCVQMSPKVESQS